MKLIWITLLITTTLSATISFLKGEQESGMNKICYYDVLGSTMTLNVKNYELCPLTYDF